VAEAKTVRLNEKIEGLRRQMQSLKEIGQQVEAVSDKQVSLTLGGTGSAGRRSWPHEPPGIELAGFWVSRRRGRSGCGNVCAKGVYHAGCSGPQTRSPIA
jgi:hypothetical protein